MLSCSRCAKPRGTRESDRASMVSGGSMRINSLDDRNLSGSVMSNGGSSKQSDLTPEGGEHVQMVPLSAYKTTELGYKKMQKQLECQMQEKGGCYRQNNLDKGNWVPNDFQNERRLKKMSSDIYHYYKMLPKNWDKAIVNNPWTICARAIEVMSVPGSGNGDPLLCEAENKLH